MNPDDLRKELEKLIYPVAPHAPILGQIQFSPRAKRSIENAGHASALLGHKMIGSEHLLLGLILEGECVAAQVLEAHGLKLEKVRDAVLAVESYER